MPGILPHKAAAFLTRLSGDLIDFANFGRTLNEKGLRGYNRNHLKKLSFIWGSTIFGGIAAYAKNWFEGKDNTEASNFLLIIEACVSAFLVSHTITLMPRVLARRNLHQNLDFHRAEALMLISVAVEKEDFSHLEQVLTHNLNVIRASKLVPESRTSLTLDLQEQLKRTTYFVETLKKDPIKAADKNLWASYEQEKSHNSASVMVPK